MDTSVTFFTLLTLVVKLGAVAFLIGLAFQAYIVVTYNKPWTWGELTFLLILTRFIAICATMLIWKYWPANTAAQQGLIFFPALIAEIIASPVALKVFKQNIFGKRTKYV